MKTYTCTRHVSHDNKPFEEGDEIELSDEHAEPLLQVGAIVDPDAPAEPAKKKSKKK